MATKRPVTILLGFLGAQPRHLKKYASVVGGVNINTAPLGSDNKCVEHTQVVAFQPPFLDFFYLSRLEVRSEELRQRIMNELKNPDGTFNDRPLVMYSLSNNGTYHYAYFQTYLKKNYPLEFEHLMKVQRGFVFDSAPSLPTADVFAKGFSSATSSRLTGVPREEIPVISPLVRAFFELYLRLSEPQRIKNIIVQTLTHELSRDAAQLYLCSRKDNLVPYQSTREQALLQAQLQKEARKEDDLMPLQSPDVREVLDKTERLSERVFLKDFVTSDHVDHLRSHFSEYTSTIQAYYEFIMRDRP